MAFADADIRIHPETFNAIACMRKFDKHGDWHYFKMLPRLTMSLIFPNRQSHGLVQRYWYEDR